MSRLSLGGLVSGMNTDDVINKILQVESARLNLQKVRKQKVQAEQSAWKEVKTSLESLRSKLDAIRFSTVYRSRKATLTDDKVASVTAASGATLTTHSLTVTTLAQAHVVASNSTATGPTSPNADLALAGTITINGQSVVVESGDTLNSLRDKFNTADADLAADVVKFQVSGADYYRLVLTSAETGTAGAIVMTDDASGQLLEDLGFADMATGSWTNELALAQDAAFTLDNVAYTASDNTVDDILPNLTITLQQAGTTSATIALDSEKVVEAVSDWVEALNSTLSLLQEKSSYDADTKVAGVLNGDAMARRLQTSLRSMLSNVVGGLPADLNQLPQVGVKTGAWGTAAYGTVLLDSAKLKAALEADADGTARVFGALRTNLALTATADESSTDLGSFKAADVINGDADSDRFGSAGGGWQSAGVPSAGSPQYLSLTLASTELVDQVRLYIPDNDTYVMADTGLKDYTLQYQDAIGIWQNLATVTNHLGAIKTFDFDAVEAQAIRLEVTATYGTDNKARVTELEVNRVNSGAAVAMYKSVNGTLTYQTGPLASRSSSLTAEVSEIDQRIARLNEYLTRREEVLRRQFARMEEALAKLQSQGGSLMMQFMGGSQNQK